MHHRVGEQVTDTDLRASLAGLLPELRAFARFLSGSRTEADDLVQEALLRMLGSLDSFERGTNLRAWAFTVLRNAFHEFYRRRRREEARIRSAPREPEGREPAQEAQAGMHDLAHALAELPPLLREALVLVGAQGLSYEDAAAVCGVPVGTMKARVSRARRQLASALDPVMR